MAKDKKVTGNTAILNVIQGISQALAGKHDTIYDNDGEKKEIGLKREVENYLTMSRGMDGFSARVSSNTLIVTYQSEILMKDVHEKKFEEDIESTFKDILKFIKKQYKNYTKQNLTLKENGKCDIKVETVSRYRTWVIAKKMYEIKNFEVEPAGDNKKLDKAIEKWLDQKSDKRPTNVTISKTDNEKE